MRVTNCVVYLIAQTRVNYNQLNNYLCDIGSTKRYNDLEEEDGDILVEVAGKLCYKSWEVGLNSNITRVRTDNKEFIENILKQGHGSVFEHSTYSLLFKDVSRIFTHELVRHRAGMGYSQESLRFVALDDLGFYLPPEVVEIDCMKELYVNTVEYLENVQKQLKNLVDLGKMSMDDKKKWTSSFRRLAPLGLTTHILATGNLRSWRHIVEQRSSSGAEVEIRGVQEQIRNILIKVAPNAVQDMDESGSFMYKKI